MLLKQPPVPSGQVGLQALQVILQQKNILAALSVFHREMGDVFRLGLPGFRPTMLVGPEANRFVLIDRRKELRWRFEQDPVAKLLGHGILVEDGDLHDSIRRRMNPALHRKMLDTYVREMVRCTDEMTSTWTGDSPLNILDEMRRVALLILVQTMFRVDFMPEMNRLWQPILKLLDYISPGLWLIWPGVPRPGYQRAWQQMDNYLYRVIQARRENVGEADDLLGLLVTTPGLSDALIRDQLLTMLIAGHDTSTALLAWVWVLLGSHPEAMQRAQAEVNAVLGSQSPTPAHMAQLCYLEQVVKETLRLYPPIHLGTRMAATDLEFQGYQIPKGARILYSIYLSHRHPKYWPNPDHFDPDRFTPEREKALPPFLYVPFGGGARICLGFLFSQIEANVVLARILQNFTLELLDDKIHPHMGATLEPRPGVMMRVEQR
jgi:cytochrome P450